MKKLLQKKVSEMLSLYIDGQLSEQEARQVEEHVRVNANLQQELKELKQLKQLLAKKTRVEDNQAFWVTLSNRIANQHSHRKSFLPTLTLQPVLLIATMVVFVGIGFGIYTFFLNNPQQNSIQQSKSTLVPVFTDVSKDEALQFVLFGLLPFDREKRTVLEVHETSQNRCRIKVAKNTQPSLTQYSVQQFIAEARLNDDQQRTLDSILTLVQERIKTSVLMGENNTLAIDPTLPNTNRIVATSIYSTLHPQQRMVLRKNISLKNRHRKLVESEPLVANVKHVDNHIRRISKNRMFVVITPETLMYSTVTLNVDNNEKMPRETIADRDNYRRKLIESFVQQDFSPLCRRIMESEHVPNQSNGILQVEVTSFGGTWYNNTTYPSQEQLTSRGMTIKTTPSGVQPMHGNRK